MGRGTGVLNPPTPPPPPPPNTHTQFGKVIITSIATIGSIIIDYS